MLHVKTNLKLSSVHGIGLFADQDIRRGEIIYSPSLELDIKISTKEFEKLDEISKWHIQHYGFCDSVENKWHLAFDNIRFCNHFDKPNIVLGDGKVVALRNIKKGEELLQDFNDFEHPIREALR